MGKRIKAQITSKTSGISAEQPKIDYNKSPIIFSLERLVRGKYCFSSLENQDKQQFAESIFKRKNLTWEEVISSPKHGLGTEKISVNSISETKPQFVTDDVNNYLALRYFGKKPMVGIRQKNVFYVLWFDYDFSLYNHG